jgi:hypothetical protein
MKGCWRGQACRRSASTPVVSGFIRRPVPSGLYFYVLTVEPAEGRSGFHEIRKMIVSR